MADEYCAFNPLERLFARARQNESIQKLSQKEIQAFFELIALLQCDEVDEDTVQRFQTASVYLPTAWRKTAQSLSKVLEPNDELDLEGVCRSIPKQARFLALELAASAALCVDEDPAEEDKPFTQMAALWNVTALEPMVALAEEALPMGVEWERASNDLTVSQRARLMATGALGKENQLHRRPGLAEELQHFGYDTEGAIQSSVEQLSLASEHTLLLWVDAENVDVTPYSIPNTAISDAERQTLLLANKHQFASRPDARFDDFHERLEQYAEELARPSSEAIKACARVAALLGIAGNTKSTSLWNPQSADFGKWKTHTVVKEGGEGPKKLLPGSLDRRFTHLLSVIWAG